MLHGSKAAARRAAAAIALAAALWPQTAPAAAAGALEASPAVHAQDASGDDAAAGFALSAAPEVVTLAQGTTATAVVTVAPTGGFSDVVRLSATGFPEGVAATFTPPSTTGTSTLVLTATPSATVGPATVTISGAAGGVSRTATVTLELTAAATPDFGVVVSPQAAAILPGESRSVNVLFSRSGGFSSEVTLAVIGLPDGVAAEFSPASTATWSQLTLAASGAATAGSTTVIVSATGGGLTRYASLPVVVDAGGDAAVAGSGSGGGASPGGCASAGRGSAGDLAVLALLALLLARTGRPRASALRP